jgi:hypothetical protein
MGRNVALPRDPSKARNVHLELQQKKRNDARGFTKSLKRSLRISRFFEGAREKFRETIVIGRCNFHAWREVVAVIFARSQIGVSQVQWIAVWCAELGILDGVFRRFCRL